MNASTEPAGPGDFRPTPWDLVFGEAVFDEKRFDALRADPDAAGAASPSGLFMTPVAGALLRDFVPEGGGREMVAQASALLFAAYRFWLHGRHVYRPDEAKLRSLLSAGHDFADPIVPPRAAGYVQLPKHLLWSRVSEAVSAEPADGFFWSVPDDAGAGADRLDLVYALGVRAGRPGLSLFDVTLESAVHLEQWANASARSNGPDFANVLPGGELQGYHAILTAAEALKLAALCFAQIADPSQRWSTVEQAGQTVHVADG